MRIAKKISKKLNQKLQDKTHILHYSTVIDLDKFLGLT